MTKLKKLAHARAGDKGDTLIISIFPFQEKDYDLLKDRITSQRVKEHFPDTVQGEVKRYEVDNIHALHFVLYSALDGGVTKSLRLDHHGKTLSSRLLEMEI